MSLAMAMNRPVREVSAYRAIYYLPSILPVFAISFVFVVLLIFTRLWEAVLVSSSKANA